VGSDTHNERDAASAVDDAEPDADADESDR
jgi:hypothetical protein